MGSFKDLRVWQDAMDLTKEVYRMTREYPFCNDFGLCNQIQRAAVSVPSNLAEGHQRWTKKDKAYFYKVASGSLAEVITQLNIASEIGYLRSETFAEVENKAERLNACIINLIVSITK